jgi:hypothetical protein
MFPSAFSQLSISFTDTYVSDMSDKNEKGMYVVFMEADRSLFSRKVNFARIWFS